MVIFDSNALQNLWDNIVECFVSKSNCKIKTFNSLEDFGISGNTTINNLGLAMYSQTDDFEAWISQGALTSGITDLPQGYCYVHLVGSRNTNRYMVELNCIDKTFKFVGNGTQIRAIQPSDFYRYTCTKG